MRIILYTGKGGVGKTSIAAATAFRSAELGHRTMAISTDVAHSLGDCFDLRLSGRPTEVAPNLCAQEIDVYQEMEVHWDTVRAWLAALMQWQGVDSVMAEEMAVLPGMEELVGLLYITRYCDAREYDVIVIDSAPTGETLRLLSFPEMARWYMHRVFPLEKLAATAIRPLFRPFSKVPIPDEKIFASVQYLYSQIDRMYRILADSQVSSIRLVMNPEKMVIKESQRTYTYLNLYGYNTDLVVCNRMIPDVAVDPFLLQWRESQRKYHRLIEEAFAPVPIMDIPLFDREVVGLDMIERVAKTAFPDQDPTQVLYRGKHQEITKQDGHYVLTVPLPFVEKGDVHVLQNGAELVVQAGAHRRSLLLPRTLVGLDIMEAKLRENQLQVKFRGRRRAKEGKE